MVLCIVTMVRGCVCCYVRKKGAITERRDLELNEVPLSMSLVGSVMYIMLGNFYMCGIMLLLIM